MQRHVSWREFIKISGVGFGALVSGGNFLGMASNVLGSIEEVSPAISKTPIYCEMCTFRCAGWAYKSDDKPWKIIGNEFKEDCQEVFGVMQAF